MKKPLRHDRNPDNTTITVAISKALLKLVDEAAAEEQRNRSNYIVYQLTKAVVRPKGGNPNGSQSLGCGQEQAQSPSGIRPDKQPVLQPWEALADAEAKAFQAERSQGWKLEQK